MNFPSIDRESAIRQLSLLGYSEGDPVYLRFFYPSNDPRKNEDKGRKSDRLNWQEIETYQRQGRGVYFVVNGGGHKDSNVSVGRAIFVEHDNLDKGIQRELWKTLELPEPTFQVDTGGKSIHSYWVFDRPIEIEQWRELQRDLLEFTGGDRVIKNPARVMRLAGAWHISLDEGGTPVYNQSQIIFESGKVYAYEKLRAIIPFLEAENSLPLTEPAVARPKNFDPPNSGTVKQQKEIEIPVPASVPLEFCLAKQSRYLLERGVAQGERNACGAKLARDLIGTHNYLLSIGQSVDGDPRQLLDNYANLCNPPIDSKEVETIWKSACRSHPTPSCSNEMIHNCIKSWYWRENLSMRPSATFQKPPQKITVNRDNSSNQDTSKPDGLDISATVATVTTILKAGLLDYEERSELDSVQTRSAMSKTAFWQLVAAIRCSLDEVNDEDTARFNQLTDWHNATLDLKKVLPHQLSEAFVRDAEVLNIDPVSLWQYFLPAALSLAGKRVNLDVESHMLPAIVWTCLVSESGTGKSRAENLILAPLKKLQYRESERWKQEILEYQQALKAKSKDEPEPESPKPERKYLFEVATIQAVMRRLAEQGENGSIWARDEIAGLFKSLGQFNSTKGESEGLECLLKMWDGSGSFVDRIDAVKDSYAAFETRLNIAGGIQPLAFRQAFKDPNDAQGLQARFLYAVPKIFSAKRVKGYCQLNDLLPVLYHWLDTIPTGTIKLSRDTDNRYTNLVEQIGKLAEAESSPTIRAWMRKLPTQLLRIALGLHLIECFFDKDRTFWELQRDTLERAVEVCRYYRSAFAVVQEKAADSDSPSSILLKIWDMAVTQPNGVTPRDIYRAIKAVGRRAAKLGRDAGAYTLELLSKLVEMGRGKLEKTGRFYRFFATFNPPPSDPDFFNPTPPTPPTPNDGVAAIATPNIKTDDTDKSNRTQDGLFPNITGTRVTEAESKFEIGLEPSQEISLSPVTLDPDLEWLLELLRDLESLNRDRFPNAESLGKTISIADTIAQKVLDPLNCSCPDYWERASSAISALALMFEKTDADLTTPPLPDQPQTGLAELKALLLAAQSLSELKALKKEYGEGQVASAYRALPISEQLVIDGISAAEVEYRVYKYVGHQTINLEGRIIQPGALVYVDASAKVSQNSINVPVWLLKGLKMAWDKAIEVSRDCLIEVESGIDAVGEVVQSPLFDDEPCG